MASSSSSSLSKHDVFLSFRGGDTRATFVGHLYEELDRRGIRAFKADEKIKVGASIPSELLQAIRESKFAVVVISENYASSRWCLEELVKIMECHEKGSLTAIPVFYGVDPSDVRRQTGRFAEQLKKYEEIGNSELVQRWRDALTQLADISGLDSRNWEDDLPLIEEITGKILARLPSLKKKYDVFLSFRGEDTRRSFVSFLYKELDRKGIITFKDDKLLKGGTSVFLELLQAIEESRFAVVVISENYASSSWNLEELAKIIQCHEKRSLTAIPVYYEVDPSDVRRQAGEFGKYFKKHEMREKPEEVQRWREAVTKLANIPGKDSRTWEDDSILIDKITNEIMDMSIATASSDLSGLVGMDAHMKSMYGLLDLESSNEVRMIGICGIAGIGKTALASYMYGKISQYFHTSCFLENVNKIYEDHGPFHLQEELLSKYLQGGASAIRIPFLESEVIRARLTHQKVLLVADDVDKIEQLDVVAKDARGFGPGSRIIIVTRNKYLLDAYGVKNVYEVERIGHSEALRLFSHFAFKQNHPSIGFEQLSYRALELAGGLPLALIVLGSTLSGKGKEKWEIALHRFERSVGEGITEICKGLFAAIDKEDESISTEVSDRLISTTLRNFDGLVGMDRRMKAMDGLLDLQSNNEVRMIGIWGIGGVGKTTLARYVYEEISPNFQNRCFLENVKKIYRDHGPSGLQEEFVSKKLQGEAPMISSSNVCSDVIKARLGHRKVLLVADGVDEIEQIVAVAKDADWFGPGSRVILITEDKSLLIAHGIKHVYEVECLRYDEALQLFCQFAFKQKHPPTGFERLSIHAVQLAGCLPLALKVFGSLLRGEGEEDWESTLHRLEASFDKDTLKILKAMKH